MTNLNINQIFNYQFILKSRYKLEHNWKNGIYKTRRFLGHNSPVFCVHFDSKILITGSRDETIKLFNMHTSELQRTMFGHGIFFITPGASVLCLQYDNEFLISGSADTNIILWDTATMTPLSLLQVSSNLIKGAYRICFGLKIRQRYNC